MALEVKFIICRNNEEKVKFIMVKVFVPFVNMGFHEHFCY